MSSYNQSNLTQFTFATSSSISDNFSYKCFQYLGIQSQTRHKIHYKPRKVKDKYPNLIYSTWDTVDRPRQVIVSDMTVIKYSWFFFELTMYFDVFTKEILTWHVAERRGHRDQYIDGLNDVINLLKGTDEPTVLQGRKAYRQPCERIPQRMDKRGIVHRLQD